MKNPIAKYLSQNQFLVGLGVIAAVWFVVEIKEILIGLFCSYIIMAALSPFVAFLRRNKVPKALAVGIAYFLVLALILLLVLPLIPFFIAQLASLITNFPLYFDTAAKVLHINAETANINNFITNEIATIGSNAFDITSRLFGVIFSLLTILVISFYLLVDQVRLKKGVVDFFPENEQKNVISILAQIEEKLGAWLRGQIILSVSIGVLSWLSLTLLNINFALPLALLAGLLEIVPTIGPIISAIPAIIVGLNISPTAALLVIGAYFIIQTLENNILVPKIMEKSVGLNPIVIIIGVAIGAKLLGVLGALLSVPFVSMLAIIYNNIRNYYST